MRDGVTLAQLGKPVAVVVQAVFDKAAHIHAEGLGCKDLPIVSYPHPAPGSKVEPETLKALAIDILTRTAAAITQRKAA